MNFNLGSFNWLNHDHCVVTSRQGLMSELSVYPSWSWIVTACKLIAADDLELRIIWQTALGQSSKYNTLLGMNVNE